jgi:hypothetical protein
LRKFINIFKSKKGRKIFRSLNRIFKIWLDKKLMKNIFKNEFKIIIRLDKNEIIEIQIRYK